MNLLLIIFIFCMKMDIFDSANLFSKSHLNKKFNMKYNINNLSNDNKNNDNKNNDNVNFCKDCKYSG